MSISFSCQGCGKRYDVADDLAGRTGKCKKCGRAMIIPSEGEEDEFGLAKVGYGMVAPEVPEPPPEEEVMGTTFAAARGGSDTISTPRPVSSTFKPKRRKKLESNDPFVARHFALVVGLPILLMIGLAVVAVAVPGGVKIVGAVVAVVGALFVLMGFFVGAYAAFTEDFLYGFGYVVCPIYTAYYIVTRWGDMWPWVASSFLGGMLVTLGTWIHGPLVAAEPEPPPAQARAEVRPGMMSLLRGVA